MYVNDVIYFSFLVEDDCYAIEMLIL